MVYMNTFRFHQQNDIGKRGEALFLRLYPQFKPNNVDDVKSPDCVDTHGKKAEIKFDVSRRARRDKNGFQTNFFMETISNDRKQTPGGLLRAQKEGVDYYVYIFEQPERVFVLDVPKAVDIQNQLVESGYYRQCRIKNQYYYTLGHALPIEAFQDAFVTL